MTKRHPSFRRSLVVLSVCAGSFLPATTPKPASAALSPQVVACRASVGKASQKLAKGLLRAVTSCHGARDRDASLASTDCNDISMTPGAGAAGSAEQKFVSSISSPMSRCSGVSPADALYGSCPAPCANAVPDVQTFADVGACIVCLARAEIEAMSATIHGAPASPLPSVDRRCETTVGSSSSKGFQVILKDVTRCQAREEAAGATSTQFCTSSNFPSQEAEDAVYDAENRIVRSCDLASFANLDSCDDSQFGIAFCVGDATRDAAQRFATEVLSLSTIVTTTTTSTTTTTAAPTTTTTLPPLVGDPQCPGSATLTLFAHDSNIPCSSNADCAPPRSCDATAGICVSLSDLDSGWTGHAHNSDLDEGVIQSSWLLCEGPAPVCGECQIEGIQPVNGSCRCANDTRQTCDQPFAADQDDCGGAACDCYFGVPIPLSSAGTPACIVNRYAEDISGTANVDDGSSEIHAKLRTRVYLGISTTNPCPVCGGTCSNNPATACVIDSDCGAGNHCNQDTPNDGQRSGLCINGDNAGQTCDVGGINPSFPAHPGNIQGGGGYSLDCMPSNGINISGAGLALDVTQTTGTSTLEANLPCTGGNCFCKTCSASPQTPCNADSDCSGGSCAVSSNFLCGQNSDCSNLNLGTCNQGIHRCQLATSVSCTTNTDCQNRDGGACNPSTCSSLGGSAGMAPEPNACLSYQCSDLGGGEAECTTGPDDKTCDGLVRANGKGILSCSTNDDCQANSPLNGNCTLVDRRSCFLDPIVATGVASTQFPVGAATFCVPPTSNGSINQVAGLPGPARIVNQGESKAFCASNPAVEYEPGVGGCPAP